MNFCLIKEYLSICFLSYILCIVSSARANEFDTKNYAAIFVSEEESLVITDSAQTKRRPNIMLFTCNYGAGHKMATQGIIESLPDCNIQVVDIYNEPLGSLDPLRTISSQFSNEHVYNNLAKKEYYRLLNVIGKIAPKTLLWQQKKIENLLSEYLSQQQQPDMLISCVPLVNPMLMNVAKQYNIPFLVITTDIDISSFCYGIEDKILIQDRNKFRVTVPYAEESWKERFGKDYSQNLRKSFQYCFGYPTRRAFSERIDHSTCEQLLREYDIQSDENLILVMMGENTAQAAGIYAKLLLAMRAEEIGQIIGKDECRNKIHVICLCGDIRQEANGFLMEQLNRLNHPSPNNTKYQNDRVRIHACPGTHKIAQLVSLPELKTVISKPGGSTVNEMIKKRVPMVYHISDIPLDWERGNMEYGKTRGLGKHFWTSGNIDAHSKNQLIDVLTYTFLLHKKMHGEWSAVPEARIDFTHNLRVCVQEMLMK